MYIVYIRIRIHKCKQASVESNAQVRCQVSHIVSAGIWIYASLNAAFWCILRLVDTPAHPYYISEI